MLEDIEMNKEESQKKTSDIERVLKLFNSPDIDSFMNDFELMKMHYEELIEHLNNQLLILYNEKEKMKSELNVSNFNDISETIQGLDYQVRFLCDEKERRTIAGLSDDFGALQSLELQLKVLYAEKENIMNKYGVGTFQELSEMFDSVTDQMNLINSERENYIIYDMESLIITGPKKVYIKKEK